MRFIAGPRQCGKTTMAKHFLNESGNEKLYYNWDQRLIRSQYPKNPYFFASDLKKQKTKQWICFDEIHKMPRWKNILKDYFDTYEERLHFIVTGSARLDFFKKSGDSLAGRYFLFRMNPLMLSEALGLAHPQKPVANAVDYIEEKISSAQCHQDAFETLMRFSGFPEPYSRQSEEFHQHWQSSYLDRLVREDLRDLTRIHDLENVATLTQMLPSRIGSPLSVNALREELQVSYNAVKSYLKALALCYVTLTLSPYTKKISRSVKKELKIYFYDWTHVADKGARFENFVAIQLTSLISLWQDAGWGRWDLHFVRTKDGKETDFLITFNQKPWLLVEAKLSAQDSASHHLHHAKLLGNIPFIQLVAEKNICRVLSPRHILISAGRFLA